MKKNTYLTENTLLKRKLQLLAIKDYFGERIPDEQFNRILKAIKTDSSAGLNEEDGRAVFCVRANLLDPVYTRDLALAIK